MLPEKETVKISKFLSLVLRHQPQKINLSLDENGWTDVTTLIRQANKYGVPLSVDTLSYVVATNDKKRFSFNPDKTKIRASQGHSVEIELGYSEQKPPAVLYHGTSEKSIAAILKNGIEKRHRHHVHLSSEKNTARKVGQRHGKPVIFQIDAEGMYTSGFPFYLSDNQVWLTDFVPPAFLQLL